MRSARRRGCSRRHLGRASRGRAEGARPAGWSAAARAAAAAVRRDRSRPGRASARGERGGGGRRGRPSASSRGRQAARRRAPVHRPRRVDPSRRSERGRHRHRRHGLGHGLGLLRRFGQPTLGLVQGARGCAASVCAGLRRARRLLQLRPPRARRDPWREPRPAPAPRTGCGPGWRRPRPAADHPGLGRPPGAAQPAPHRRGGPCPRRPRGGGADERSLPESRSASAREASDQLGQLLLPALRPVQPQPRRPGSPGPRWPPTRPGSRNSVVLLDHLAHGGRAPEPGASGSGGTGAARGGAGMGGRWREPNDGDRPAPAPAPVAAARRARPRLHGTDGRLAMPGSAASLSLRTPVRYGAARAAVVRRARDAPVDGDVRRRRPRDHGRLPGRARDHRDRRGEGAGRRVPRAPSTRS